MHRILIDCIPPKTLKAEFAGNQPMGRPRFKLEEGIKKMLPDFSSVTTGS
jgi:hypothetical protein